jgi:hypothetical protein
MLTYFIDYNKSTFDDKTFMAFTEFTNLVTDWVVNKNPKVFQSIQKILKNKKLLHLLSKINNRNYSNLYYAKHFSNLKDVPELNSLIKRDENVFYSWTNSSKFAMDVSEYYKAVNKPQTGGIVAKAKNIKAEDIIVDVYRLYVFLEEIFSEIDITDFKIYLRKIQKKEFNPDTVTNLLSCYHKLEKDSKKEQEVLVQATIKNNKAEVVAWYIHEDGFFEEEGWKEIKK